MQQQAQQPVQAKPVTTQKPVATAQTQKKPDAGKTTQPIKPGQAIQPVKKSSKWWLWLIVILFSLGVGFVAGYFFI